MNEKKIDYESIYEDIRILSKMTNKDTKITLKDVLEMKKKEFKGDSELALRYPDKVFYLITQIIKQFDEDTESNNDYLIDCLHEYLSKKTRTQSKYNNIGCFVECLVEFGSSQNAAILYTSDLLCIADTKTKTAYYKVKKQEKVNKESKMYKCLNIIRFMAENEITQFKKSDNGEINKAIKALTNWIDKEISKNPLLLDPAFLSKLYMK